jgi:superfamily II DNA or RNA helicase
MNEKTKKFLKELKDSGKWNDECDYSKVEYIKKNEKVIVISKKFNTVHFLTPQALLEGRPLCSVNLKDGVLPFEEAREFVRGLKLKDGYEWKKYYKSGLRPYNIPTNPGSVYKNSGWVSLFDWLIGEPIDDVIIQELKDLGVWYPEYDYSKFKYISATDKLTITCPIHGDFHRVIGNLRKTGKCPKCMYDKKKVSTEDFITRLKSTNNFNENYDYSKVNLKGMHKKILIIDKTFNSEHTLTPNSLLSGNKCTYSNFVGKMLTYEESKEFVKSIGVTTQKEWFNYWKKNIRPYNVPFSPYKIFKNSGWVSWGEWLGTGTVACARRKYRPFSEALEFARSLKLKNQFEWETYRRSGEKPNDIPSNPEKVYRNDGWISLYDWLGTKIGHKRYNGFLSYNEARDFIINLKFETIPQWNDFKKSKEKPNNIPRNPHQVYKDSGWVSYYEFLGILKKSYPEFEEAKVLAQNLKCKTIEEYQQKTVIDEINLPKYPYIAYKDSGWVSWSDYLNSGNFSAKEREYFTYDEAKEFFKKYEFKSSTEFLEYKRKNPKEFPPQIHRKPSLFYKNKGWVSYNDLFSTDRDKFLPYLEAREFALKLNFKSKLEWLYWRKSGDRPNNIPSNPDRYYKDNGWTTWGSWLGFIGDGKHIWHKQYVIDFVKSLEKELNNLDSVELITIINSNNLALKLKQIGSLDELISTHAGTTNRSIVVKNILDSLENLNDDDDDNNGDDDNDVTTFDEIFVVGDGEMTVEEEEDLEPLDPIEELRMYDNERITVSLDDENIDFLLKNQLKKLWNRVLNNKVNVENFRNEYGGDNFTIIKDWFFNEYDEILQIVPPSDYIFNHQPNLMQRLISYRLINEKRYGNWSGTGAGKTLSAIFAGRLAMAKNTIIICNNATVEGWVRSIGEYFSNNKIYTKTRLDLELNGQYEVIDKYDINFLEGENNYLVLNYETFQFSDGEYIISELLKNNTIDYIVFDEVQNVKQREDETQSVRREVVNKLIIHSKQKNDNLLVMAMSATPVINNLVEPKKLIELITGETHEELKTVGNINNGVEMYKALTRYGLRYKPDYGISENEIFIEVNGTHLKSEIEKLHNSDILTFEKILLNDKLTAIKNEIKKGTLIYTHYVDEIRLIVGDFVRDLGFSVGYYTGEDKSGLKSFKKGETDVLIGSAPIGTGVDGIQYICNTIIGLILPWTSSEYDQLKGRVNRQGSNFDKVNIYIPQVVIPTNEGEWSWDKRRYNIIKYKSTLADLAVDGFVPNKLLPPKNKLLHEAKIELLNWFKRLDNGEQIIFEREELSIPLNPTFLNKHIVKYGEFSNLNQRWNVSTSYTTGKRLNEDPTEWYHYHTLYREARKDWNEIPYIEIAKQIKRTDYVIADLGCGENLLKNELPNKVLSFDHVAIDDTVIACDISNIPLEDETIDVVVFSLSLMGTNYGDYLKEAYRILKPMQPIMIAETSNQWKNSENDFKKILLEIGFNNIVMRESDKFIYVTAFKM